jgi:16S rRNA (uracil1498-N3)-methyltransferase
VNVLLLEPHELDDSGRVRLRDRRATHLIEVLRTSPGQRLRAGLWRGRLGEAEVLSVAGGEVTLAVELDDREPPPPLVDLVLALPRPKVLSRVIETAASFGVRRIDLVNAWRVEKAYLSSPRLGGDSLLGHARLGCEQGGHGWLPDIQVHPRFVAFLEQELRPRLVAEAASPRLLAHPQSPTWLEQVTPPGPETPITVAIGPEGGWIEREVDTWVSLGFLPVAVSQRTLRVESAVAAVLSALELCGRLALGRSE